MAWNFDSATVLVWNGVRYVLWDPGGDGNCLFNSLAFLLSFHGIATKTQAELRGIAADGLDLCTGDNPPVWFDEVHYEKPTKSKVAKIRDADGCRYWGDMSCILAILATQWPDRACQILDVEDDDEYGVEAHSVLSKTKRGDIHLLFKGSNHYVALVPEKDLKNKLPDPPKASDVLIDAGARTVKLDLKLSTSDNLSSGINTSEKSGVAVLEIHHINVGQGDATLIQILGGDGSYKKSILIDAGKSPIPVRTYLYSLIGRKAFRKIDVFVASHYDDDHIGGAPKILTDKDFVQDNLVIYDTGAPVYEATGYAGKGNYLDTFGEPQKGKRRMPDLYQPIVDKCEGVTIHCVALLGFVRAKEDEYLFLPSDEPFKKSIIDGTASQLEINESGLDSVHVAFKSNECSIALLLEFGEFRYFTAGDLESDTEIGVAKWLFDNGLNSKHLCACKLGHHGSHESTRPEFLKMLRPRLGVVSSGNDKSYGHPSQILIDRFNQLHEDKGRQASLYVTADLTQVHIGKGIPWGTLKQSQDKNGQGSILLTITQDQAKKHAFTVRTTAEPKPQEITCGKRDYDEKLKIEDKEKTRKRSETQKEESRQRKEKRKREASEEQEKTIQEIEKELDKEVKPVIYRHFKTQNDAVYLKVNRGLSKIARDIYEKAGDEGWKKKVSTLANKLNRGVEDLKDAESILEYLRQQI